MPELYPATQEKEIVYLQPVYSHEVVEDEIDLLDLWSVLWQGKWLITLIVSVALCVAVVLAYFVLPIIYKSEAVLLEIRQTSPALEGLSGVIGKLPIPLDTSGNQISIVSFLQSRTLKERLIDKYDLLPNLYNDIWDGHTKKWLVEDPSQEPSTVKALQSKKLDDIFQVIPNEENSLVTISWVDASPSFAKEMLDRVVVELRYFLENEYVSNARKEREFVEHQLEVATKDLELWERQVPTEDVPYARISRERLAAQTVYTELRKQLEVAKITEAKENITFKVLDAPFVPEYPFKPKKILILLLAAIGSFCFGVFVVFFREFLRNLRPKRSKRILKGFGNFG